MSVYPKEAKESYWSTSKILQVQETAENPLENYSSQVENYSYVHESPDSEPVKNQTFIDYSKKKKLLIRKTDTLPSHYMSKIQSEFMDRILRFLHEYCNYKGATKTEITKFWFQFF